MTDIENPVGFIEIATFSFYSYKKCNIVLLNGKHKNNLFLAIELLERRRARSKNKGLSITYIVLVGEYLLGKYLRNYIRMSLLIFWLVC